MKNLFTLAVLFIASAGLTMAQVPVNNECTGAIDITPALGQPVGLVVELGPYDNTNATTEPSDPTTGYECFGEPDGGGATPSLENTLWFSFVGDGGIYYIRTNNCSTPVSNYIDDGDTQIAIYTGTCGSLVPYTCNEDGPEATSVPEHYPAGLNVPTIVGETYYMLIDGFKFFNALSTGEFCIFISQIPFIGCTDPSISTGITAGNKDTLCPGDTLRVNVTGVTGPNEGLYNGMSWVVSTTDITGSTDPLNVPGVFLFYAIQNPAPDSSGRMLLNNGQYIGTVNNPYGTYYFTPVIFANATPNSPNPVFLSDLTLDPSCTYTGTSIQFHFLPPGDPLCVTAISSIDAEGFGILNLYPNPVRDELSVVVATKGNEVVTLTVFDQTGREMLSKVSNVSGEAILNISTKSLAAGVYFVKLENGTNSQYVKFLRE
jgi:hypothetical protein